MSRINFIKSIIKEPLSASYAKALIIKDGSLSSMLSDEFFESMGSEIWYIEDVIYHEYKD